MRRLLRAGVISLGVLILGLGLLTALSGRARATSPFRKVAACDAGFVWLTRTDCPSTWWCSHDPDEALFLEWDGDLVTIGTRFSSRPATPELKRTLFRALESIADDPTPRATAIAARYDVEARCRGAHAFASASGTDPNLKEYLQSAALSDWPLFLRWEFSGAAWHTKRLMTRVRTQLRLP